MSTTYFIIPCGGAKLAHSAKASELYASPNFRLALAAAQAEAEATTRDLGVEARVLIMSALHGIVELDAELEPYDVKVGDADAIGPVALAASLVLAGVQEGDAIYAMLPRAYRELLEEAAEVPVFDVYEAAPGIGFQRGVSASLLRSSDLGLGR